jgi:protein SCO1/2
MKRAACLAWLGCALSLGPLTPALADRLPQQVNPASAGWPLGAFTLTDHRGAPFTQENLRGRWTLLLLEDGRCGAPCEAALSALAGLYRRIHATQAIRTLQGVLILPEPHGGPPERLGQTLARFDPRFIGAHGSRAALQGLADDLGVALPGFASEASPGYVSHGGAGSIWVIGPDGILRAELLPPFDVLLLTAEFMKIRSRR